MPSHSLTEAPHAVACASATDRVEPAHTQLLDDDLGLHAVDENLDASELILGIAVLFILHHDLELLVLRVDLERPFLGAHVARYRKVGRRRPWRLTQLSRAVEMELSRSGSSSSLNSHSSELRHGGHRRSP
eukprot:11250661-Heterocapsa_arctica.AAC.1